MIEDFAADAKARSQRGAQALAQGARELADIYRACFASEAGAKVLADLQRCYGGSTTGEARRTTEQRTAQRDVLMRIEDLVTLGATEPGAAIAQLAGDPEIATALLNPWSDR